ncbi:MAG: TonB-dependent receptor [Bacteroidales bacterium]|nr:TonB-dependent receptor [Bacteroidales bacterium]
MKITLILLFTTLIQLSASVYSQTTKFSFNLVEVQATDVLKKIEDQSEFRFFYQNEQLNDGRKVSINVTDKTIEEILDDLFKGQDIKFKVFDDNLILLASGKTILSADTKDSKDEIASLMQKSISGKVTNASGEPLAGVSVVVKGSTSGSITDINGNYSLLNVPENATLQFSFVGMKTQEINVGNQRIVDAILSDELLGLDEVIVVGYGTQKKVNLTGSVDAVSGDKLKNRSETKVANLLRGVSPNLAVNMDLHGGEPGAESTMSIRGMGSIQGDATPLVLVDGVEMNLNNVDPESIESISVLKDASASAIYGSRAPFGVVLITTKSGKKGEKIHIQYNNNVAMNIPIKYPSLVDALTWTTAYNQANANAGLAPVYSDEQITRIKGYMAGTYQYEYNPDKPITNIWAGRREGNANNDWPQIMMRDHSFSQKHNINVSGGDGKTQYYLSGGMLEQEGMYTYGNDSYKRYNFLANFKSQVTDWLSFNSSLKYANSVADHPDGYTTVDREYLMIAFLQFAPMMPMYNVNGSIQAPFVNLMQKSGRIKSESNDFFITIGSEIEPIKGWKTSISYNHNIVDERITDNPHPVWCELGNGTFGNIGKPASMYYSTFDNTKYSLVNMVTSYEKKLGDNYFKVLAGYEQEDRFYSYIKGTGTQLITDQVPSLSTSLGDKTVEDEIWHWATQGVFGRINYNFKEKYLLELSARYNGSSKFKKESRWGFFPSASVGYNISKENFWAPIEQYVNMLKLRASYGSLGNQNVNNYLYLSRIPVYNELNWIINGERPAYSTSPALISDDLTWETITTANVGMDAAFLKNRLEMNFDWYNRVTTDMLGPSETLPYTLGASTPARNNAELSTKGFEVVFKWKDRISNDFSYNVQVSIGDNRSTILKYKNDKGLIGTWYNGKEVGEIWGYETDKIIQEVGETMPDQSYFYATWGPGDIKYKDLNNDGKIDPGSSTLDDHGDLKVIGNTSPRYNYSFMAGFNWKGFDFSMLWHGVGKRDYFSDDYSMIYWGLNNAWGNSSLTRNSWSLDYWRPANETNMLGPNTDSYFPKPYFTNQTFKNRETQSRYLLNAAYLRLKNVQLGYTIPERLSKKIFVEQARIYFSGENLFAITKLPKNFDPESTIASDPNYGGYNTTGAIYPITTTLSLGINLTF